MRSLQRSIQEHFLFLAEDRKNELNLGKAQSLIEQALPWIEQKFRERGYELPLSLQTPLWLVSLSLVKLQPVIKTDNLVPHPL